MVRGHTLAELTVSLKIQVKEQQRKIKNLEEESARQKESYAYLQGLYNEIVITVTTFLFIHFRQFYSYFI